MYLYNTLTRMEEQFQPLSKGEVKFYHCGPTVYWVQHIGNLRAMTWADLIRRSLTYLNYKVKFVRNYTDVGHLTSDQDEGEDKMAKGVKREGLSANQIAEKYINIFDQDTAKLNIIPPDSRPRATQFIPEMIEMINVLLSKKNAYIADLAVYFDTTTFKDYNLLNKQKPDLNEAGSGKGSVEDAHKKNPADFALWFFKKGTHKNALQTWPSPWGEGFPGWHIECSVMAKKLLGDTIDIHMGGIEHIAIHHTNEIAQSESANGVKFVNYWLHNEHLNVQGEKMAKSQGTGLTLTSVMEKGYDPLDLRYLFLNAHYRSKQNFTWEALNSAKTALSKLREYLVVLKQEKTRRQLSTEKLNQLDEFRNSFRSAISRDFQIPQALATTWEMLKSNIPATDKFELLLDFDQVLGLGLAEFDREEIPADIAELAKQRKTARISGDYNLSDKIRQEIENKGYQVEDEKDDFKIKKKQ